MIKRTLLWLAVGYALGTFVSMWFGPEFLAWWSQPPGGGVGANMCINQVKWATHGMVTLQLGAGISIGVLLAIVVNVFAGRGKVAAK